MKLASPNSFLFLKISTLLVAVSLSACAAPTERADDESTPQEEESTGELSQAVTSFTVAPKDAWFVRLDWPVNPETDVAGYRIWRNGVVVKTVAGRTTTTYFDPTRPTTTYSYQYSVFDIAGNESAKSAVKVVTTPAPTKTGCSVPTVATQSVVGPVQFPGDLGSGIIRLLRNSANACGGWGVYYQAYTAPYGGLRPVTSWVESTVGNSDTVTFTRAVDNGATDPGLIYARSNQFGTSKAQQVRACATFVDYLGRSASGCTAWVSSPAL